MFKFLLRKGFCNKLKPDEKQFKEAKKKAMEMYQSILHNEKLKESKEKQEEITSDLKVRDKIFKDENFHKKIEDFLSTHQHIESNRVRPKLVRKNPIENGEYNYDLKKLGLEIKDDWILIYNFSNDEFDRFKRLVFRLMIIVIIFKTFKYIQYFKNEKYYETRDIIKTVLIYTCTAAFLYLNRSISKKTIKQMFLNVKGDKIKFSTSVNKEKFLEIDVSNCYSITSKKANSLEIFLINKNRQQQFILYKNAFFDNALLSYIFHPNVRKININNF